jgi:CDP-glycerol glycerophosphotransferase (TagB/SpsB family)
MPNLMRVCYLVSHGFSARMVLHSRLIEQLNAQSISVQILAPAKAAAGLKVFERENQLTVHSVEYRSNKWIANLADFKRYLREPIRNNAALWSRHQYVLNGGAGSKAKLIARFNYLAHRALYWSKLAQATYNKLDQRIHRSSALIQHLETTLLVSTYPVTAFEVSALLAAKELGIPTVGHLLSWDNITCKGKFTVVPDYFISWGSVMSGELKQFYRVAAERIFECGVPHFDAHREMVSPNILQVELKRLGLIPEKPYLFFGMSAPIFAPHEIDIVERLTQEICNDTFGTDMQLVIRPHPQNVTGNMADASWLPRIQALQGPRIGVNMPLLLDDGLAWNMDQGDLPVLVNLLHGCSVCLNSGSTLSIDALCHQKPVVLTMFDRDDSELPWWKSARRIRDFPHYKTLLSFNGLAAPSNFLQFIGDIKQYLANPLKDLAYRQLSLAQECGQIDGQAPQRVVSSLKQIVAMARR